jgi:hypothetical protein
MRMVCQPRARHQELRGISYGKHFFDLEPTEQGVRARV